MVTTAQSVARYRIVKSTSLGDSQIKLSGQRVELDEIAHALLQASKEKLTNAHVCVRGTGADTSLVAFVVFSNGPLDEEVDRITYLKQLRQRVPLPQYMWLSIMISLEELPLNLNGKVDGKALDVIELPNSSVDDQVLVDLDEDEMTLLGMWEEVLPDTAAKGLKITKDTDLYEAGGNSLSLVRLQSFIKERLGVQVPLVELVESCSLEAMARRLWSNPLIRILEYANLEADPSSTIGDAGRIVILTGASGFLKKQVLQGLVLSSTVSEVHCIAVRSQTSMEKLNAIGSPKIIVHTGDLTLPRLGLDIITARSLASRANIIVHNGAHVSFLKSYSSLKKANVGSTAEFVRLAKPRRIPIHFVSSAGVAGFVPRNELPLREANQQYGLDIVLHRPTGIVGEGAPDADILGNLLHYSRQLERIHKLAEYLGSAHGRPLETLPMTEWIGRATQAGMNEMVGM
ncbi:male sterility protein-domain-containing protein [Aspergillus pseudocaelatus]|uniref:Male sterility protein-domain-containing protein n=1 Tax=Aspergillus pseudocaelatus TaxID=1825620 RepID=A0ABQ6X0E5_9EURO|nr:male sterility protein-domain-containing protein [Aspergillus pseudocaelatus]